MATKWEYRVESATGPGLLKGENLPDEGENLNDLGRDGWELFLVNGDRQSMLLFLRRPLTGKASLTS